jgi:hypothetical protein
MRFMVGPWAYRVRMMNGLKDGMGNPAQGLCDGIGRNIWIDAGAPLRHRLTVLIHELRHAWHFEMGKPGDNESDVNQTSSFTVDVWRQLERQGGETALMRLTEEGLVDHAGDDESPGDPRTAQCPQCSGPLDLPIRTGSPEFHPRHAKMVAERFADCEFCNHTVTWMEVVTNAGVPTGRVISDPEIRRTVHAGN